MASWNSVPLHVSYDVLGWFAFASWSISFYPQVILNFRRKSVVGLNFDFVLLNLTKHSSYLIYNATLFFSSVVQKQYRDKYGQKEVSVFFDILFMCQHYLLYPVKKRKLEASPEPDNAKSLDRPLSENV
uniref:Cystinosin isogeny n=1 Tax=Cajanus cajan TaxID=3821 RepID=A0A151S5Y5_CAJCA|nr:Cystinosin isogeny [Cajanus cajan]